MATKHLQIVNNWEDLSYQLGKEKYTADRFHQVCINGIWYNCRAANTTRYYNDMGHQFSVQTKVLEIHLPFMGEQIWVAIDGDTVLSDVVCKKIREATLIETETVAVKKFKAVTA